MFSTHRFLLHLNLVIINSPFYLINLLYWQIVSLENSKLLRWNIKFLPVSLSQNKTFLFCILFPNDAILCVYPREEETLTMPNIRKQRSSLFFTFFTQLLADSLAIIFPELKFRIIITFLKIQIGLINTLIFLKSYLFSKLGNKRHFFKIGC